MIPIRPLSSASLLLLSLMPGLLAQDQRPQPNTPAIANHPAIANYVVHEWGTFTSMADTQGVVLEGMHHEEEHLPRFVHDLMRVEETDHTRQTKLPASYVTQKMETPVIYFYADKPLRSNVSVGFTLGLMTQFYPLPTSIYPRIGAAQKQLVDMRKVAGSRLTWDIDILPRGTKATVPSCAADDPWHFARQTSANLIRTRPDKRQKKATAEAEHYLFYRGLGRWQPDVSVKTQRGQPMQFHNAMGSEMPFSMALELGKRGGRYLIGGAIQGRKTTTFDLATAPWHANRERFARRVGAAVLKALVEQGLYMDEARAMVATWSRQWFQSDGTRVIYLLPRKVVDKVLPLQLNPKPKQLVRVMVGRHEFITPQAQAIVEQALQQRQAADQEVRARGEQTLQQLDRFLEPHLRNVERNGSNHKARRMATELLRAM